MWKDYRLKWDPLEYGNITKLRLPANRIWIPGTKPEKFYLKIQSYYTIDAIFKDILMYNSVSNTFDSQLKVNAVIDYNGAIEYLPPAILKSTCEISIKHFPFDEQLCHLNFGTWTYDITKVNVTNLHSTAQLDSFTPNGEWHLLSILKSKI